VSQITTLEKEKAKSIAEFKTLKRDKDSLLHDINTKIAQVFDLFGLCLLENEIRRQ